MKQLLIAAFVFILAGCASSIADINTSKSEPACVRQCTASYSQCVAGPSIGFKTELLRACKDAYAVCISTCQPSN